MNRPPTQASRPEEQRPIADCIRLEWLTLFWNVVGVGILLFAALKSRSVAVAGFGLDSLIEIGASMVVVWDLMGTGSAQQMRALRLTRIESLSWRERPGRGVRAHLIISCRCLRYN